MATSACSISTKERDLSNPFTGGKVATKPQQPSKAQQQRPARGENGYGETGYALPTWQGHIAARPSPHPQPDPFGSPPPAPLRDSYGAGGGDYRESVRDRQSRAGPRPAYSRPPTGPSTDRARGNWFGGYGDYYRPA